MQPDPIHNYYELTNIVDNRLTLLNSLIAVPQFTGQNNTPSGGSSPWGLQPQYIDNFYNNPIQCPTNLPSNNPHCFQVNGTTCYPQHQQTSKSCHSHYPAVHGHSDYQSYNHQNIDINPKCGNQRMCNSCDALTSPQQPILPNPANWGNQSKSNGSHPNACSKQNSQQQLYQCSSEYSDHSIKSHSQHSHSSQDRSSGKENTNCHHRSIPNRKCTHNNCNGKTINCHLSSNGTDILNGNGDNIYENDDETADDIFGKEGKLY